MEYRVHAALLLDETTDLGIHSPPAAPDFGPETSDLGLRSHPVPAFLPSKFIPSAASVLGLWTLDLRPWTFLPFPTTAPPERENRRGKEKKNAGGWWSRGESNP